MSNNQKNHYGSNVSWFCYEGSLALNDSHDQDGYVLADFDIDCDNGCVNVSTIALLESASVVIDEQLDELEQLRKERGILNDAIDGVLSSPSFDGDLMKRIAEEAKHELTKLNQQGE